MISTPGHGRPGTGGQQVAPQVIGLDWALDYRVGNCPRPPWRWR